MDATQMQLHAYWSMGHVMWEARVHEGGRDGLWLLMARGTYQSPDAPTQEDELDYLCDQVQAWFSESRREASQHLRER